MKVGIFILIVVSVFGVHGLIETSAHEKKNKKITHFFVAILEIATLYYLIIKTHLIYF